MTSQEKICFVIAPIGEGGSLTRQRSDKVLKHVIRPAVEAKGYRAIRADDIAEPGLITGQVIQHIVEDSLVVADLTENNPNVFYELALRHAVRKPLVQLIEKGASIPFDVAGMRTIPVDHKDLDSVDEAKAEIGRQVASMERPGATIDTPVSVSIELQGLRQSDKPANRLLGQILTELAGLRTDVASLKTPKQDPPASDGSSDIRKDAAKTLRTLIYMRGLEPRGEKERILRIREQMELLMRIAQSSPNVVEVSLLEDAQRIVGLHDALLSREDGETEGPGLV